LIAKKQISTITIIGSGNVASSLAIALNDAGITIAEVFSPNILNAERLASKINSRHNNNIADINITSDLYLIAITDKEIATFASHIKYLKGIIAHTSGSEHITALKRTDGQYGVFYPLQTFTKGKTTDTRNIPICIEGSTEYVSQLLSGLAGKITNNVVQLNSDKRQFLHLSAVTVNNFSNLMYTLAHDILTENDIDFSLLHPLIYETAIKIIHTHPSDAQTGPARRNDTATIGKHLELLKHHPEYKEIYKQLSNHLIRKYNEKL
jgi:predicted short-subunit dehydrogenase-like oxidoreductase (DUF2520 family)